MRRRLRQRLFWTCVFLGLTLLWLTAQVLRAAEAISGRRGQRPLVAAQGRAGR